MKILHINSYYYGSPFYKNLYDYQQSQGFDIRVYVPVPVNPELTSICDNYAVVSHNHKKSDRLFFYPKHKKILSDAEKLFYDSKFNIIHAHSLFSNGYIALSFFEKHNIPYIVTVRNTDVNLFFKYMIYLRPLGLRILKSAGKIIFLSAPYKNTVIDNFIPEPMKSDIALKSVIIPNGIDNAWLANRPETKILNLPHINIVYAGVINNNKNCITTAHACLRLIKAGYAVNFNIIGQVQSKSCYSRLLNFAFVKYHNKMSKEELMRFYKDQDIFTMPSIHESFGLVYAEALSQGLPVIYTRGQGFDKQFTEGYIGYAVNPKSAPEIEKAVLRILNEYDILSNNALEACKIFSWAIIHTEYCRIYSEISGIKL